MWQQCLFLLVSFLLFMDRFFSSLLRIKHHHHHWKLSSSIKISRKKRCNNGFFLSLSLSSLIEKKLQQLKKHWEKMWNTQTETKSNFWFEIIIKLPCGISIWFIFYWKNKKQTKNLNHHHYHGLKKTSRNLLTSIKLSSNMQM